MKLMVAASMETSDSAVSWSLDSCSGLLPPGVSSQQASLRSTAAPSIVPASGADGSPSVSMGSPTTRPSHARQHVSLICRARSRCAALN